MRIHLCNLALLAMLGGAALAQNMPKTAAQPNASGVPQSQQQVSSQQAKAPADVQNEIQSALQKDPTLANASITVQVTEQSVELSGTVPTKAAKDTAEQIAQAHAGGLEVKNRLKVAG
jgi:osmotically-inducible protein OsmY